MSLVLSSGFLVAALAVQLMPGPGMLFIIAHGVDGGVRAGVGAATGAAAGMLVHTTATALGLAAVLSAVPAALKAIQVVGGIYLLWLAFQAFRAKPPADARQELDSAARTARSGVRFWSGFSRGALNNLANPKVMVFYLVFLPQFVDPSAGDVTRQLFILGAAMLLIGLVIDVQIGVLAGRLRAVLLRSRGLRQVLNKVAGTIYAGLAARLIITH